MKSDPVIVSRKVDALIPYIRNSRTHSDEQVAQIAASVREFGWTNPVLIDGENGIIAGHGRVLAARKLGMDEVPCIELAGLTDTQRRAYIIADNRTAELAGWDNELLAIEFAELADAGFDNLLTGFTQDEIDALTPEQIPEGLTFAALSTIPLKLRAVIQWYKIKSGLGAFMSQYIPNCEPCMYLHKTGCSPAWYGPTNEKTVWELKKEARNEFHPTQKPVELPERAVTNSSKQGDLVLDLFGGSGSTLIACEKTGRHARLMELDPKYVDVIVRRWQEFTGKQATHAATGATFAEVEADSTLAVAEDV